jgi:hypothetical protein
MEIYGICNWKISPFNDDLNNEPDNPNDYAFLIIPKDKTKTLDTTDVKSYLVCSCPVKQIQAIFPQRSIEVVGIDNISNKMLLSKIVIDDGVKLPVVVTKKDNNGKYIKDKVLNITPGELASSDGINTLISTLTGNDLALINATVSRDPPSCKN